MNQICSEISEHYRNLINEIDILSEKAIDFFKSNQKTVDKITSDREKLIVKVNEVEKIKLTNLKHSISIYDGIFCFIIPTNSIFDSESNTVPTENEREESNRKIDKLYYKLAFDAKQECLKCRKQIAQLVILNCTLNKKIVEKLISNDYESEKIELKTFEESFKFKIISELINSYTDDLIIDLTQIETNRITQLILSDDFCDLDRSNLNFVNTILNVPSVKEIKIKSLYTNLPNNLLRPFKCLTKLNLNVHHLEGLNQELFNSLENLQTLKLSNVFLIKPELNSFEKLSKLNKLILYGVVLKNFDILENLQNLKKLVVKKCVINLALKSLNGLNSLESLKLFDNEFKQIDKNFQLNLKSLKSLESNHDLEIFKINPQLEILSLKPKSLKNYNNFEYLKFLNIQDFSSFEDLNFLNGLSQLEFLDFKIERNLTEAFESVHLPKLKFLILTCETTPFFNETFMNLNGLELTSIESIRKDQFVNLLNLDYLCVFYADFCLNTKTIPSFLLLKHLKYLKIETESDYFNQRKIKSNIIKLLLKLFQDPNEIAIKNTIHRGQVQVLEISAKLEDDIISEKVYFEKYLQVSECVREFILSSESIYLKECLRNERSRLLDLDLTYKSLAEDSDEEKLMDKICG
ncbi:unnamed protein product [Brachionus calyciflorus]|uniref:Uncharacterized protein n=1 Tax=Brachionus calyciflorus TaxID=104777 RepID=A0A814MET6_9BILA|nr:unnamed protein product [Brachionus calyciflorus]